MDVEVDDDLPLPWVATECSVGTDEDEAKTQAT